MSSGGFGNLFLRGSPISGPLAKAIELEFGICHKWLLTGSSDSSGNSSGSAFKFVEGYFEFMGALRQHLEDSHKRIPDNNLTFNSKEIENFNSVAYRRYKADGPQFLGDSSVDLKPQTVFYDPNVPLEELTEEHLWIGGSSTPKTILKLIERVLRAEQKIEELETELKYFSGQ